MAEPAAAVKRDRKRGQREGEGEGGEAAWKKGAAANSKHDTARVWRTPERKRGRERRVCGQHTKTEDAKETEHI